MTAQQDLSAMRHRKGISLHQISDATKIGIHYLEAIEHCQFAKLPGGVYTVSYIRQYAQAIEVSEEQLLTRYRQSICLS
jgi:cytoskeletal protein RodZ